jgi:histidyl-tRNA synthetase
MAEKLSAVKGMNDILPPAESEKLPDSVWQWFESKVRMVMARYGYQYLLTPIVEPTPLFVRGLGEVTDIVEKEMYSFDRLAQRRTSSRCAPRTTAGIVRAMIEHSTPCTTVANARVLPWGRCSATSARSAGRYRQFHQIGVEALGFGGSRCGCRNDPDGPCPVARAGPD